MQHNTFALVGIATRETIGVNYFSLVCEFCFFVSHKTQMFFFFVTLFIRRKLQLVYRRFHSDVYFMNCGCMKHIGEKNKLIINKSKISRKKMVFLNVNLKRKT